MSWSFHGTGKPKAVLAKALKDCSVSKLNEPEETIRAAFLAVLKSAVEGMPESSCLRVTASGSQWTEGSDAGVYNTFRCEIEPVYGFIE